MNTIRLDQWRVCGFWPYVPLMKPEITAGAPMPGVTDWLETGPGESIYTVLRRYGYIEDPRFERNSVQCEWVSNRWWVYQCVFRLPDGWPEAEAEIIFEGIDYQARIYLNGAQLGTHEGMCLPFRAPADGLRRGRENYLVCVVESAPDEFAKYGYTNRVRTLKPRYNYYWDFCTRMVSIGLCGPVTLRSRHAAAIRYAHLRTLRDARGRWRLSAAFELDCFARGDAALRLSLERNGVPVCSLEEQVAMLHPAERCALLMEIPAPDVWQPNGCGDAALYRLEAALVREGATVDRQTYDVGFRTVEYLPADGADGNALPYRLRVNGRDVYLKGVNLVPLDLQPADVTGTAVRNMVESIRAARVNLVRVWGGGLIESEAFYRECNRCGILVWQEFPQSSAGLDDTPCTDGAYLALLRKVAAHAVKQKRNHPCLVYWCGGNELCSGEGEAADSAVNIPVGYDNPNIAMLTGIVAAHDSDRLFLPSSGSVGRKLLDPDCPEWNYDVHGPWQYAGVEEEYRLFNRSNAIWNTEYGCGGLCPRESMGRFLLPENIRVTCAEENLSWRHHGGHWDKYREREQALFGGFGAGELDALVKCSQFLQGEAIRYGMEENRRKSFCNCGSILWEYNDPWPNLHSSSVVDYYGRRKLGYHLLADACRPLSPTLRYHSLVHGVGSVFRGEAVVLNDGEALKTTVRCEVLDSEGRLLHRQQAACVLAGTSPCACMELAFPVGAGFAPAFEVVLTMGSLESRYLFFVPGGRSLLDRDAAIRYWDRRMEQGAREGGGYEL